MCGAFVNITDKALFTSCLPLTFWCYSVKAHLFFESVECWTSSVCVCARVSEREMNSHYEDESLNIRRRGQDAENQHFLINGCNDEMQPIYSGVKFCCLLLFFLLSSFFF